MAGPDTRSDRLDEQAQRPSRAAARAQRLSGASAALRSVEDLPLQGRITAAALLTSIAVLLAGCGLFMLEQSRMERYLSAQGRVHLGQVLQTSITPAVLEGNRAEAGHLLGGLASMPSFRGGFVRTADGDIFSASRDLPSADEVQRGGVTTVNLPIVSDGRRVGELVFFYREPPGAASLPRYLAMAGALFFAATGLALFLGRWLATRISEPVNRLTAVMHEVAGSGDFRTRVESGSGAEFRRLTDSFNALLAQLHTRDVALRQTMGELVEARDAAEAANVLKSHFLANMSHEIRTPLNGVLAMAQVMALEELTPTQRERLDVIRQSGEALMATLNDVLDVSKIEAGKLELIDVDFDIEEVARSVQAGFTALAEKKEIELELAIDPSARGARHGDAARFRQILNNLVSNALKFTPNGKVKIALWAEGEAGADSLRLDVSDTGIGIPPEKLPLLFDKFTQVDNSATRQFGGTGLGLAICHELTRLMGGRIWVESREEVGSTFSVSLPLRRVEIAPPAEPTPPKDAEGEARSLRVLAAEDNATNRRVLATVMQIFGVELVIVDNGQMAVDAWRAREFDVVLMDIQMPVMDGLAATRAIRDAEAASGRRRTPVIALSANALTHQVSEYLAAGMDAHVAKPIELPKLQAALKLAVSESEKSQAA